MRGGANRGKAKRGRYEMTSHDRASKQHAETDYIIDDITRAGTARAAEKPSRVMERKSEPMTSPARRARRKPQHSRIIPEEMLNSGADRKYTKMTGS